MTLQVLVERIEHGQFRAVTSQPIALSVEADSPRNAVRRLKEAMERKLSECEVIELDIPPARLGNPWSKHAGVWKEHPDYDAFREAVTEYRRSVDASQE